MDDEEIFEIIDEKKEIIADLEKEMSEIERTLGSELEDVWIVELQELVLKRERDRSTWCSEGKLQLTRDVALHSKIRMTNIISLTI
jgi:regulator of replication initiation timing